MAEGHERGCGNFWNVCFEMVQTDAQLTKAVHDYSFSEGYSEKTDPR